MEDSLSLDPKIFLIVNHELVINKDYIRGIEEFKVILERKKTCKGDSDGRKKIMAYKELLYMVLVAGYDSYLRAFDEEEKSKRAKRDVGLPTNWSPDEALLAAIDKYVEILDDCSPSLSLLNALEQGLMMSKIAVKGYLTQMQNAIKAAAKLELELKDKLSREDFNKLVESLQNSNSLIEDNINKIMATAMKLPKVIGEIKKLKKQVIEEKTSQRPLRGDKPKGRRED